jgi:hypothetical protein
MPGREIGMRQLCQHGCAPIGLPWCKGIRKPNSKSQQHAPAERQMNDRKHYYVFGTRLSVYSLVAAIKLTKEDSMKSLAYVFAALLTLAIAAPSLTSAEEMHHHHHHHHEHHHHHHD